MADLSFVVFSEQGEYAAEIHTLLEATGHARVARIVSDPEELAEAVRSVRPDALFADLGLTPHTVIDLIDTIPAPRPLLMVCGPQDGKARHAEDNVKSIEVDQSSVEVESSDSSGFSLASAPTPWMSSSAPPRVA